MKKVLLVGGAGFVGGVLSKSLEDIGFDVSLTCSPGQEVSTHLPLYELDLLNPESIKKALAAAKPEHIYHLAAQSSVGLSWEKPGLTIDVNIKGSVNLLDAVRKSGLNPRILMIGSGEEYGHIKPGETPVSETNPLRPGNIYAATKASAGMLAKIYADAYKMDILIVRPFNHIGPSQAPIFVVADFCKQVAEIEAGKSEAIMQVGNLAAKRDFTDVRDVVRAYILLMEKGRSGEIYNIGRGESISIQELLNLILSLSTADIKVEIDPKKLRPVDVPDIEADISKLKKATGWAPEIPLEETIKATLDYWRGEMKKEA